MIDIESEITTVNNDDIKEEVLNRGIEVGYVLSSSASDNEVQEPIPFYSYMEAKRFMDILFELGKQDTLGSTLK